MQASAAHAATEEAPVATAPLVIVHGDAPFSGLPLSSKDLGLILLGKKRMVGSSRIRLVMRDEDLPAIEEVLRCTTGKSPAQFRSYWKLRRFSGQGDPPALCATDEEVATQVRGNAQAIGLIASRTVLSGDLALLAIAIE